MGLGCETEMEFGGAGAGDGMSSHSSFPSPSTGKVEESLEIFREDMAKAFTNFGAYLRMTSLRNLGDPKGAKGKKSLKMVSDRIEYVRDLVKMVKLFPDEIVIKLRIKLLEDCRGLLVNCYEMLQSHSGSESEDRQLEKEYLELVLRPSLSMVHDCLEVGGVVLSEYMNQSEKIMFQASLSFLMSSRGRCLARTDFLRVLGLCQRLQKDLGANAAYIIDNVVKDNVEALLVSENGRSLLKFCCEICSSADASYVPEFVKIIASSAVIRGNCPELYMAFASYLQDMRFWRTSVGIALTPTLIKAIRQDLTELDKSSPDTRKRASFVLRAIIEQYSCGKPIFDPSIPEVASISLGSIDLKLYKKFWTHFFDVYEILNETQIHIVQPVLSKMDIFQELSSNPTVMTWLPILLKKLVCHDNRAIVKEGLMRFLQTRDYILQNPDDDNFRILSTQFLQDNILPLIKDHVGWVLNDPGDFFKAIKDFAACLLAVYSSHGVPQFQSAETILNFLTTSGKCMGSHAIYFLVAAMDEVLTDPDLDGGADFQCDKAIVISKVTNCINRLAHLLSNSVTTISKLFRNLMESHCVNIVLKISYYFERLPEITEDEAVFSKLLAILGSLSAKLVLNEDVRSKLEEAAKHFYSAKRLKIITDLTIEPLYNYAQSKLSPVTVLGLLRFLSLSFEGLRETSPEHVTGITNAVNDFALKNAANLKGFLKGCSEGLSEFYRVTGDHTHLSYMFWDLLELLKGNLYSPLTSGQFECCSRYVEVVNTGLRDPMVAEAFYDSNFSEVSSVVNDPLRTFLFRKLIFPSGRWEPDIRIDLVVSKAFRLEQFDSKQEQLEKCEDIQKIADDFFNMFERNLFAEFYHLKFLTFNVIVNGEGGIESETDRLAVINSVLDSIEKCDSRGVAAALRLVKSLLNDDLFDDSSEIAVQLESLASIGYSLVFELRKTEAFWHGMEAFAEFIVCPHFLRNGILNKHADLIFEQGETVPGLILTFVEQLITSEFPTELMRDANEILVKAALAGGPLAKNNRVSFGLWNYLRWENEGEYEDPEHFSSDCKARLLACDKLSKNLERVILFEDAEKGHELLRYVISTLIERNNAESKNRKRYFGGSFTHRLKQRIHQILLALQPHFNKETSLLLLDHILDSLSSDSPQPSVRYMGEWLATLVIVNYPELQCRLFQKMNEWCIQTRVGFGALFATICLQIAKQLESEDFYYGALQSLAILILSHHVTVRVYAQIAFEKIYEKAKSAKFQRIVERFSTVLKSLEGALLHVSGNCSKLREGVSQDFYVNMFDCKNHYHYNVIFTLLPKMSGMINDECALTSGTIVKLTSIAPNSDDDRITKEIEDLYNKNEKTAWHLKTVTADGRELGEEVPNAAANPKLPINEPDKVTTDESNYQKKINPWRLLTTSEELEEYSGFSTKKRCVKEEGLIVVASLLENLPNLGGLCRTCEIFGVSKYVVNSLNVANDLQFQNLSVSAQNWVNMLEVPPRDLESFLLTYSAKGYTILGVEQANKSSSLQEYKFPKKSVLLLGNEKLGIPSELLRLVDGCIEIPQVGIIRSLNVHVTGALCIWKYASQHVL